jgi:trans-L-3-hydroxyproline dehydratase
MCGHAIIALTKFVLDTGFIDRKGEEVTLQIDGPAGRIISTGFRAKGKVNRVVFRNVPSFVLIPDVPVQVPGLGKVNLTIAYGGAFYAFVDATALGIDLSMRNASELISLGRIIKKEASRQCNIEHPFESELGFLYGTIFTGKAEKPGRHSRNVCIFADGQLDRSATGTGVSARAAIHYQLGEIEPGEWLEIESIIGTALKVRVADHISYGPHRAIIPDIEGHAHFTARSDFWFDPDDPLENGFFLG